MEIVNNGKERSGNGKANARMRVWLSAREVIVEVWEAENVRIFTLGFLKALDTEWQRFDNILEKFILSNANKRFNVPRI